MNEFNISLYSYSEHLKGYFNGYPIYASLSRQLGRALLYKMKLGEEAFIPGFMDTVDRYWSVDGLIRLQDGKITGFYPCDFEESFYGPQGLL